MIKIVPTWVWLAIIVGLAAIIGIQYASHQVTIASKDTQIATMGENLANEIAAHQKLKADQATDQARREKAARDQEHEAQAQAEAARKKTNAEIDRLATDLVAARSLLNDRPTRAAAASGSDVPATAGAGPRGAAPSELYREDANVALDIAADADRIRIGLEACYRAYDRAEAMTGSQK